MKRLLPVVLALALAGFAVWRYQQAAPPDPPPAAPADAVTRLHPPDDPPEAAKFWASTLSSPDSAVRREAATRLGAMGVIRMAQFQALTAKVQDSDAGVRLAVSNALKSVRVCNSDELVRIVGDLHGSDSDRRKRAAYALWQMSSEARPAMPVIAAILMDASRVDCHYPLIMTLNALGRDASEAVPAIRHVLVHGTPEVRARAVLTLPAVEGPTLESWKTLVEALRDPDANVRWTAAELLLTPRSDSQHPEPPIFDAVDSETHPLAPIRDALLVSPLHVYPDVTPDLGRVAPLVDHGDPGVRLCAVFVLLQIASRPNPELVLEPLLGALHHRLPDVRWAGARALGRIGASDPSRAAPALARAMGDMDAAVRREAFAALDALKVAGRPAVPILLDELERGPADARRASAGVLAGILLGREERRRLRGRIPLSPEIERALATPEFASEAIWSEDLARWGIRATAAIPGLTALVRGGEEVREPLRLRAIWALREFGTSASSSVPALLEAAAGSLPVRRAALEVLAEIDPGSETVTAAGRAALADADRALRLRGAALVLAVAPRDEAALRLLREEIASPEGPDRDVAVRALGRVASANPEVIGTLAGLVSDKTQVDLRRLAAESLAAHASGLPAAREAIANGLADAEASVALGTLAALERSVTEPGALLEWAKAAAALPETEVRVEAIRVMGRLQPRCREAIGPISQALSDGAWKVRQEAALALMRFGPAAIGALPALRKALTEATNDDGASACAEAIFRIGTREAIAALFEEATRVDAGSQASRAASEEMLRELGPRASVILPDLIAALDGPPIGRALAADLIGGIGREARSATPALAKVLRDEQVWVQSAAVKALERMGQESVPILEEALIQPSPAARILAAGALLRMDGLNPRALPVLLKYLEFEDDDVRRGAIREVGKTGAAAAAAVPALAREILEIRWGDDEAVEALGTLGPAAKEGRAALLDIIDANSKPRTIDLLRAALRALSRIGIEDKGLLPRLRELDNTTDGAIRMAAAVCRLRLDPADSTAMDLLLAGLESDDYTVSDEAVVAFERIGPAAERAVPRLIGLAEGGESRAVRSAATALGRIGPTAKAAVPTLMWMLGDESSPGTVAAAAEALGRIGPEAREAVPELRKLEDDSSTLIRRAVRVALRRIAGE